MFTGIILGLGVVESINPQGQDARFSLRALFPLEDLVDGESMAVNGTCLSIEKHDGAHFTVYASAETLKLTTLNSLKLQQKVNLERALALGERLGGHLVTGHVDGIATLISQKKVGKSQVLGFSYPAFLAKQIIPKGSVTLDGISLTVNSCTQDYFEVNVIPDTQKRTNCSSWKLGSKINLETDILGKYVQRMLEFGPIDNQTHNFKAQNIKSVSNNSAKAKITSNLSQDFLSRHGF